MGAPVSVISRFARVATFGVALLLSLGAGAQAPRITGKAIKLGHVDAGTLPAPIVGGLVYDVTAQRVLASDGGTWTWQQTTSTAPTGANAIRFNAVADRVQNTAPPNLPFTVVMFGRIETDRNDFSTFYAIELNSSNGWVFQTNSDGVSISLGDYAAGFLILPASAPSSAMTVGTWYCISVSGTSGSPQAAIYRAAPAGTPTKWQEPSPHPNLTPMTPTSMSFGADIAFGEQLNGDIAGAKIWSATLSDAEIETECDQIAPVVTANLWAYYPFDNVTDMLTDASGNGRTLTNPGAAGSYTQVAGPFP